MAQFIHLSLLLATIHLPSVSLVRGVDDDITPYLWNLPKDCIKNINGVQFHREAKSWIGALEHCFSKNSSLVQITDDTVQDAVNCLLQNCISVKQGVWIGLERSIFGGVNVPWKWISGIEVKKPKWISEFVDPLNNHCGKIIQIEESQPFGWQDDDCHKKLPFICHGLNE